MPSRLYRVLNTLDSGVPSDLDGPSRWRLALLRLIFAVLKLITGEQATVRDARAPVGQVLEPPVITGFFDARATRVNVTQIPQVLLERIAWHNAVYPSDATARVWLMVGF
jgi:hypothetical protein